ncbi:hypothetical protein EMIT0158MI4_30418 [Burkholderia ambifaria]
MIPVPSETMKTVGSMNLGVEREGRLRGRLEVRLQTRRQGRATSGSRHGRIAATCWISNCRGRIRTAPQAWPLDSKTPGKFGDSSEYIALLPGFLQIGSDDFSLIFRPRDCFSNRLRKTRRAFLQAPASEPTCAIEHFFHT